MELVNPLLDVLKCRFLKKASKIADTTWELMSKHAARGLVHTLLRCLVNETARTAVCTN